MKKPCRILAANLHQAVLFKVVGRALEVCEEFSDAPWQYEKQFTDKPGISHKRVGFGEYSLEKEESVNDTVTHHFFQKITSHLDQKIKTRDFQYLYLFIEPQALGFFRKHATKEVLHSMVFLSHTDIIPQTSTEVLKALKKKSILLQPTLSA